MRTVVGGKPIPTGIPPGTASYPFWMPASSTALRSSKPRMVSTKSPASTALDPAASLLGFCSQIQIVAKTVSKMAPQIAGKGQQMGCGQ